MKKRCFLQGKKVQDYLKDQSSEKKQESLCKRVKTGR